MAFSSFHPLALAIYYISAIVILMFASHPWVTVAALIGGIIFYAKNARGKNTASEIGTALALFLIVSLSNPLFSHNGSTPLFFINNNPVTAEAVFYGMELGAMLVCMMVWFKCLNLVLTNDKILYLIGSVSPKAALLISSTLRFVPLLKERAHRIKEAQSAVGLYASEAWIDKLRATAKVYSALISQSLEDAVISGASMKARGYGIGKRTAFSLFRFRARDAYLIIFVLIADAAVFSAIGLGELEFVFYPSIYCVPLSVHNVGATAIFLLLCLLPSMIDLKEAIVWRYYVSKI